MPVDPPDPRSIDFREHPELYRIGRGEQGVLTFEPYKGELLPHWRFKTPEAAKGSSTTLYAMFEDYLAQGDFPGADMARKFLQMGWTRARRYANHKGGRKYDRVTGLELPRSEDPEKAAAAAIFHERYVAAREHPEYLRMKAEHRQKHEGPEPDPLGLAPTPSTHRPLIESRGGLTMLVSWGSSHRGGLKMSTSQHGTIESTSGVCGGSARIAGTRIPVWILVEARDLEVLEAQLLLDYPALTASSLADAWDYAGTHPEEIAAEIRRNEVA